jgi:hypothetical protein
MTAGNIYVVAGTGKHDFAGNDIFYGDGGPAIKAGLSAFGVAVDPAGNILVGDYYDHRIRRISG